MLRPVVAAAALALAALFSAPNHAAAQGLVPCAPENGFCRLPYPTRVIYGVPGRSAQRDVRNGIPCTNQAFGDPAPGIPKSCAYVARRAPAPGWRDAGMFAERPYHPPVAYRAQPWERHRPVWRTCASENQFCAFQGRMRVRYGAAGRFAEATFHNGVNCTNRTFGDVAPGMPKICQVLD